MLKESNIIWESFDDVNTDRTSEMEISCPILSGNEVSQVGFLFYCVCRALKMFQF